MCLISKRVEPFVADKDIRVLKLLKIHEGGYRTPYTKKPIKLNAVMVGERDKYSAEQFPCHKGEGYVHSYIGDGLDWLSTAMDGFLYRVVEAFIPAGTKYFVDNNMDGVCSESLRLTDSIVNHEDLVMPLAECLNIVSPILAETDGSEGVSAGWLVRSDRTFIRPSEYADGMKEDIIGVVGGIVDGDAVVVALDEFECRWLDYEDDGGDPSEYCRDNEDAEGDMDGRRHTRCLGERSTLRNRFNAFGYAEQYETRGTKKGDWYLGAAGEYKMAVIDNCDRVNASLLMLGAQRLISTESYWTSTRYSDCGAWFCEPYYCKLYFDACVGIHKCQSRPIMRIGLK